jgi:hypothetical protein
MIVWLSLALFSGSVVVDNVTLGHAHTAVGAIMVAIACSFVVWCIAIILRVASPLLHGRITNSIAYLRDCMGCTASSRQSKAPRHGASGLPVGHHNRNPQLQASQSMEPAPGGQWQVLTAYASGV